MKPKITIISLLVVICLTATFVFGFLFAKKQYAPDPVTTQTVLRSIQNEGFFVTQELIVEEKITIDNRTGNALKDFFISENIEAEADLRIAVGVDTNQLTEENIRIEGKTITLHLPDPKIFSTEIVGDVDIDSKRGIITKITDGEDDYNGLVATLKEQARASLDREEMKAVMRSGSKESIQRFMNIITPTFQTTIIFNTESA